ncbi:hypothetical protein [Mucilaginibacter ginkgonis]|uniref:Uncharacterized protein n=1 Tax=Mucilaginibacter ginkgonis TaxID=2682091 RepID=A0A6I4HV31_9SPHI|nr:hypothetical protein [Mucilaginibacter ginkgonis]QQL50001.1 hypothetical protein GO620_000695 [Mucilaginibacter ginkgonis]
MENAPIICRINKGLRPPARCGRGKAKPPAERTTRNGNSGFLNTSFTPVFGYEGNRNRQEREFKNSLHNLCEYYQLAVPDLEMVTYPHNIYQAWTYLQEQVGLKEKGSHLIILEDKTKKAVLSVINTFDLNGLYYIPVRAYWKWWNTKGQEKITELVTALFAYLHQVTGVPFYSENGSFMDGQYETLDTWMQETEGEEADDDENKAWREKRENTMYELRQAGCHILRRIQEPCILKNMEKVITHYRHADNWELEWELLGIEFLQLYRQYPKRSIHDNIHTQLIYPAEDETISAYQYTGFYWSGKDCFADDLDEMINSTLQEIAVVEEPNAIRSFEKIPDSGEGVFSYEKKLFELMERLRDLLNEYDHEDE